MLLETLGGIFGVLREEEPEEEVLDDSLTSCLLDILLEIRQDAKKEKNWGLADKIRDKLSEAGIALEDTPEGTRWRLID